MDKDQLDSPGMPRRHFLGTVGKAAFESAFQGQAAAEPAPAAPAVMPMRKFGRADAQVSLLGLGGHHLGECKTVEEALQVVHEGIDGGITFFDNCWEYYNGRSENWMGRALEKKREKVFLMSKVCTHGRDGNLALKMLDESLRRLRTDRLDLWQVHGVTFDNDPELAYAKGGVLEAFDRAKKQGKVRFTGFTGHKDPGLHLDMLRRGYPFDAVQMPLNPFDATFRSFEKQVLPELTKRGIAALAMKTLGGNGDVVKRGLMKAEESLRYAMSLPVTTVIAGMESIEILRQNLRIARDFKPLTADEMQTLRDHCAEPAADGRHEPYKVSLRYDNPQAREAHAFPLDPTQKEVKEMFTQEAGSP